MTEANKLFLPDFVDLYMSFLTKLLEASPTGLLDIYEFSAEYFENQLKERPGKTKMDKETLTFQRDVPNSPGKRQFLPDFSYDSILILHPELSSSNSSFEENMENLLHKEMQVIHHLNDPISQQKQKRNLLKNLNKVQKKGEINRFTNQDSNPNEHEKAFLEDQKFLRREREKRERVCENERQENHSGSVDKDPKEGKKQTINIDLEKFLKDCYQKNIMDKHRDRKDNLKLSNNNNKGTANFDNIDINQDLSRKYFSPIPPNHSKVPQQRSKKNNVHRREQLPEDELEKRNIHPSEHHKNKMKLQTIKTSNGEKTFIDAQFSSRHEVLHQIVEFSKLLPKCLEVMNKLFNDSDIKTQTSKDQKDNSHFVSHLLKIPDSFPAVLDEACETEACKQKTSDKTFCTTSSQTDFAELMNINGAVLTSAMFEYVRDVINAARRLLYSVSIRNCNHLPFEEITDGLSIPEENNTGFNDFQNILESWKNFLNKPENVSIPVDQNYINKTLEKKHLNNERLPDENKNAWQYESRKEPKNYKGHGKSDSNHDFDQNHNHPFESQANQNKNEYACSLFKQEICHQNENCCGNCNSDMKTTKKRDQNSKTSNGSSSNKKSSNHSVEQNKRLWDDISGSKERHNNGNISRSQSDSVISLQSNHDACKKNLAKAFLSRLEEIYQTDERNDPFFRSSPGFIQVSVHEPSTDVEKTNKSTGDLHQRTKSRDSKSEGSSDRETEHRGKELFSLLDPRRSHVEKGTEKYQNIFYKIPDNKKEKYKRGEDNHVEKLPDFGTDKDMQDDAQGISSDSETRGPIHTDSTSFFISTPILRKQVEIFPEQVLEKKSTKSTGDVPKEMALQFGMEDGRRKRFKRKLPPEDKLHDPRMGGFFTLLDPKRSFGGRKEISYQKLTKVDFGTMAVETEINAEGQTKLIVHDIHQATSKLQMNIMKSRQVYKEAELKMRTKSLDSNWHVPVTGKSWLRSYFTSRMIRRYQKQLESDKIDTEIEDQATPVLKHCECKYGFGSYFSQRSILGSIRMWYFSKKMREYQKSFDS